MNRYKTSEIAKMFGIHVNTVRLYESCGLIPKPERTENGYRIFTDIHVEQMKLARAALHVEVLQNGLRKQAVQIIKVSAAGDYDQADELIQDYIRQVDTERANAEEAIEITRNMLFGFNRLEVKKTVRLTRKETADVLRVSIDTLRNWELNGLFTVKRKENGYRVYTEQDLQLLKIIRSLRCANYSLASILRMLNEVSQNPETNIRNIIDTPKVDEEIITACDRLLTSLKEARENAEFAAKQIMKMKEIIRMA